MPTIQFPKAIELVEAERRRQIAEGYGPDHDAKHTDEEIQLLLEQHLNKLKWTNPGDKEEYTHRLAVLATVATAALERSLRGGIKQEWRVPNPPPTFE